jgi:Ca2+:H+ antiporter
MQIGFRRAPKVAVATVPSATQSSDAASSSDGSPAGFTMKRARLKVGQLAPTSGPGSTVLLCTYRATGSQYYKYTVGGVNIMFINLLPMVFFTIIDAFLILPAVEKARHQGHHIDPFVALVASQAFIFVLGLASVIPLSYFIGMAVASISAQSSIGMGAVINATFGSVIEIVLYSIALTQGKGRLVEGSIVGSILAGVLFMPGISMCSGALKRKEQKFNAKSAGVTSTMLIMAIIGTLTPTLFYQTYGSVSLVALMR